jgi:hypothetical protein
MTMPVVFYLVGAAVVPIAFHFISRRNSRLPPRNELDHAIETLPRIQRQLREILELHQEQRAPLAKATVNAMRDDCSVLLWLIFRRLQFAQLSNRRKDVADSRHPAYTVLRQVRRLDRNLRRILHLARYRADRITDGHHLVYAATQHTRVWIEYMRFLRALYPEAYADLLIPGDIPMTFARSA